MWLYKGFETKKEALECQKRHEHSRICYEKSDIESRGKHVLDYRQCLEFGLSKDLLYVVIWEC